MKRALMASFGAVLLLGVQTAAAGEPMMTPLGWGGLYGGPNIGGGFGNDTATLGPSSDTISQLFWTGAFTAGAAPSSFALDQSGFVGGGQLGYNFQNGRLVLGIEGDIQGANVSGSQTINTSGVPGYVSGAFTSSQDLQWLGTVRGRAGYAWNNLLAYATGGVAFGGVHYGLDFAFAATNDHHSISATNTETGWTIGGGLEWQINNAWSIKGEYLYVDLGSTSLTSTPSGRAPNLATSLTEGFENRYSIFRVGLNYRFGEPAKMGH